jgi:hypothetical protein
MRMFVKADNKSSQYIGELKNVLKWKKRSERRNNLRKAIMSDCPKIRKIEIWKTAIFQCKGTLVQNSDL